MSHCGDIYLGHQAVREVGLYVDQPHPAQRRAIAVLVQLRQPGAYGVPAVSPLPQQVSRIERVHLFIAHERPQGTEAMRLVKRERAQRTLDPPRPGPLAAHRGAERRHDGRNAAQTRSEEHTSELQSQSNLVCRLLLEKKKNNNTTEI